MSGLSSIIYLFPALAVKGVILHNRLLNMARYLSQNWLLGRRHFLRGLGASLAFPMLDCMRPLRAGENSERARSSVFIYLPNGVNMHDFPILT